MRINCFAAFQRNSEPRNFVKCGCWGVVRSPMNLPSLQNEKLLLRDIYRFWNVLFYEEVS